MSCNCIRQRTPAQQIKADVLAVSLGLLKQRREACKSCPFSTKNPNPKYAKFGGLTNLSKCTKSDRALVDCLKDTAYECPENKFGKT